jgi:hypothetical protein
VRHGQVTERFAHESTRTSRLYARPTRSFLRPIDYETRGPRDYRGPAGLSFALPMSPLWSSLRREDGERKPLPRPERTERPLEARLAAAVPLGGVGEHRGPGVPSPEMISHR